MISRSKLWEFIQPVLREQGLKLFDIDLPGARAGVLRIYIQRDRADGGANGESEAELESVNLDDCIFVTKTLERMPEFEDMLPESTTLEVSSPGVNRRLRREEHFADAIGEHVKISFSESGNRNGELTGTLQAFDGEILRILPDRSEDVIDIAFKDVVSARVDFLFQ